MRLVFQVNIPSYLQGFSVIATSTSSDTVGVSYLENLPFHSIILVVPHTFLPTGIQFYFTAILFLVLQLCNVRYWLTGA
jgi:hypothetical protein